MGEKVTPQGRVRVRAKYSRQVFLNNQVLLLRFPDSRFPIPDSASPNRHARLRAAVGIQQRQGAAVEAGR